VEERSKQVAFIADVYKEAKMVLVWHGQENSTSCLAFGALLRQVHGKVLDEQKNALRKTFEGGYWNRLWVVQELYHARQIIVRCRLLEIDWATLSKVAHNLNSLNYSKDWVLSSITAMEHHRNNRSLV
jgi:hypothetical protein